MFLYIIFLKACDKKCPETEVDVSSKTTTNTFYDTIWQDSTRFHDIPIRVPVPYYQDTTFVEVIDSNKPIFDDVKMISIYEDSITDDTVSIQYKLTVLGEVKDIKIGYKLLSPLYLKETTIEKTEIIKSANPRLNSLFIGVDIGGNLKTTHIIPEIELHRKKSGFSLGYNLIDKSVMIGLKHKIF